MSSQLQSDSDLQFGSDVSLKASHQKLSQFRFGDDCGSELSQGVVQSASKVYRLKDEGANDDVTESDTEGDYVGQM